MSEKGEEPITEEEEFLEYYEDFGEDLLKHFCGNLHSAIAAAEEHYAGFYENVGRFARITNSTIIPRELQGYINWDLKGAHMKRDNDIFTIEDIDGVYVFWNR